MADTNRALEALAASGLDHDITRHGRVSSLAEAADARGVSPAEVIKTMVVRRGEGDHLLVLVPGDRTIAWPKLRRNGCMRRCASTIGATRRTRPTPIAS